MNLENAVVVGLGELLWDIFPEGKKMGGAPANFSYHTQIFGCQSFIVSSVGKDGYGDALFDNLQKLNVDARYIQTCDYPTGSVVVKLDQSKQPHYDIKENVAWDYIVYDNKIKTLASNCDVVCIGSLAQRCDVSRNTIQNFLKNTSSQCLRIFDVNLRQSYYNADVIEKTLQSVDIVKMNEEEFPVVEKLLGIRGVDELLKRYGIQLCTLTLGEKGSLLITLEKTSKQGIAEIQLVDPVGAGDAFTAALAVGKLQGLPLEKIHKLANCYASYVCSKAGATPEVFSEFVKSLWETEGA